MDKLLKFFRRRRVGVAATLVTAVLFLMGNIAVCIEEKAFSFSAFVITLFIIGLLILVAIGIYLKKRKVAEIASSVTLGYMGIFIIGKYAGYIRSNQGAEKAAAIFFVLGGFCLLGALVFVILRAFGVVRDYFSFVSTVILLACILFNLVAVICYLVVTAKGAVTFSGVVDIIALIFVPFSLVYTVQDQGN